MDADYHDIKLGNPHHKEHIVVTDGYYYKSGYWIEGKEEAYFYPDPEEPFAFVLWAPTEQDPK